MPRPSGTQTRTFNYGNPAGAQLLSATNPENGTVTYTYNSDKTLATKTDAKNQQVQYSYDSYKRVTQIRRGTPITTAGSSPRTPASARTILTTRTPTMEASRTTHWDGSRPCSTKAGRFLWEPGQLQYHLHRDVQLQPGGSGSEEAFADNRRMNQYGIVSVNLDATYTYDNEGRMTATQYPSYLERVCLGRGTEPQQHL